MVCCIQIIYPVRSSGVMVELSPGRGRSLLLTMIQIDVKFEDDSVCGIIDNLLRIVGGRCPIGPLQALVSR
jgi:hypothetical protein